MSDELDKARKDLKGRIPADPWGIPVFPLDAVEALVRAIIADPLPKDGEAGASSGEIDTPMPSGITERDGFEWAISYFSDGMFKAEARIADLERERDEARGAANHNAMLYGQSDISAARLRKAVEGAIANARDHLRGELHQGRRAFLRDLIGALTAALQPEPEPSLHWTTDGRSWQAIPHAGLVYNISVASFHHDPSYALKIEANGESIRTLYDSVNDAQAGAQSDYARRAANHVAAALQPEPGTGV